MVPEHALEVGHGAGQIEVPVDHRAHHDAVEMGRGELRGLIRVHRPEPSLGDPPAYSAGDDGALLVVEALDDAVDHRFLRARTRVVEHDLDELANRLRELQIGLEPVIDQVYRIAVALAQTPVVVECLRHRVLDGGAKQRLLAVEIVIDERRVDARRLGDVLDRDRSEVAAREQL